MSIAVKVPSLGESVVEGTVAQWLVQEGDFVEADQIVVELTTDKVDVEIPAPSRGVIEKILVAVDESVGVGADLAMIDPDATQARTPAAAGAAPAPAAESGATPAPPPAAAAKATPVARRIAEDARVDLDAVQGTGSAGRITKDDVLRHSEAPSGEAAPASPVATSPVAASAPPVAASAPPAAASAPPAAASAPPAAASAPPAAALPPAPAAARQPARAPATPGYALQPGDRVVPMSRLRKLVADHMVYSKRTSPHVGTVAEVDMSAVVKLRSRNKTSFQDNYGVALTFLPFIVHAAVRALRETPALNASVIEDAIVEKQAIHIGIAVETEKGLVVPVVRSADRLSIAGLAAAIDDLSTRARSKKLSADELQGGTFTITNPGRRGNLYGFAIINQPQVGILRLGEMVKRPVVRSVGGEDAIVIRSMMHLALSYDHRAVDGQPANAFLYRIRELLEAAEFDL